MPRAALCGHEAPTLSQPPWVADAPPSLGLEAPSLVSSNPEEVPPATWEGLPLGPGKGG